MVKVAIVGAAGGIGQPLSLLMKLNPKVTQLALYDVVPLAHGVAADVSHINTPAKVSAKAGKKPGKDKDGKDCLVDCEGHPMHECLKDADIVIIPAGVPRKPGMTRQDLFAINAGIVAGIADCIAEVCPNALVGIISNPVNSTVPIFCETMKKHGKLNPKKIFGVSTLDILRANTFVAELKGLDVNKVNVPVIGGHSGNTIVPLLSRATPGPITFTKEELDKLTVRIQNAGTEVVEAKAGAGSATLSMAQAGARFANSLIRGLSGEAGVMECTYVISDACKECEYFATEVELGKEGVAKIHPIGKVSDYEQALIEKCVSELKGNVKEGVDFVAQKK